jgi:UDP-N-acetylmuramoyl-L-alanyl-D-glutamate--2,6-diaminopimelate ligase
VRPGFAFVAVPGTTADGHDYLHAAAAAGAAIAIVEHPERSPVPALVVGDARRAAAVVGAAYYNDPARAFTLVAVTGTNGKTTTVGIVRHLLDTDATPAASMGTLGVLVRSAGDAFPGGGGLTTPGPIEFHRVLRALADAGIRQLALEASSHALAQHRLDRAPFAAAVFTNLTRDHLDYHETMEAYFAAKAHLVSLLGPGGVAVVNADDPAWAALPAATRRITFGLNEAADVRATDVQYRGLGSVWTLRVQDHEYDVHLPLAGDFNVANALGAAAACIALGADAGEVAERLATVPQVPGRLERLNEMPAVFRDYAHTPNALERALAAMRPFAAGGRLIVVFGCGGDRDPGKRPQMGAIAERLADHIVLTSDNPRTENPERILDDIEAGLTRRRHDRIEDRRAAIAHALDIAARDRDVILLAGKGHETYQVRGTEKLPFDEAVIVRELLAAQA